MRRKEPVVVDTGVGERRNGYRVPGRPRSPRRERVSLGPPTPECHPGVRFLKWTRGSRLR